MARRSSLLLSIGVGVAGALGAALAAGCTDLFHGFDDLENACGQTSPCADDDSGVGGDGGGVDAAVDGPSDGGTGPVDFCAWDSKAALGYAQHACAWLGACESPMGKNQLGECMVQAVLAFDCAANPTMPVRGALKDYWNGLRTATSCKDVYAVTLNGNTCGDGGSQFSACGVSGDGLEGPANTRVECLSAGGRASGERCLASGQTCVRSDVTSTVGRCTGSTKLACTRTSCNGDSLNVCTDAGVDIGRECTYFGAGTCAATDAGVACAPASATACSPTAQATCSSDGTTAMSCITGQRESVRCDLVLPGSKCVATKLAPGDALVNACGAADAGKADAGGDGCSGGGSTAITSTARGVTFTVGCSSQGLGTCSLVQTLEGPRAACAAPRASQ